MPPELATAPDPATNTAPTPVTIVEQPESWDFLDTPDASMPDDRLEFDEDREARLEKGEGEPSPEETKPEEKAPETAAAETKPEEAQTVAPEITEKATYFDEFDNALKTDPAAVAQAIIDGMDARQKADFLRQYGAEDASARSAFDVEAYEPQGEMETALRERWSDIETIPALVSETKQLNQNLQDTYDVFVPQVSEANILGQLALAKIDALCQALEMELPDADFKVIADALRDGKTTYRDAVRKAVNYGKTVEAAKQRKVVRPNTPGNESRKPEPIPEGTSMVEIARRLGTLRR